MLGSENEEAIESFVSRLGFATHAHTEARPPPPAAIHFRPRVGCSPLCTALAAIHGVDSGKDAGSEALPEVAVGARLPPPKMAGRQAPHLSLSSLLISSPLPNPPLWDDKSENPYKHMSEGSLRQVGSTLHLALEPKGSWWC